MIHAYLGPDTIIPLTSVLAAIGGVLLLMGRRLMAPFRFLFGRRQQDDGKTPRDGDSVGSVDVEAA